MENGWKWGGVKLLLIFLMARKEWSFYLEIYINMSSKNCFGISGFSIYTDWKQSYEVLEEFLHNLWAFFTCFDKSSIDNQSVFLFNTLHFHWSDISIKSVENCCNTWVTSSFITISSSCFWMQLLISSTEKCLFVF